MNRHRFDAVSFVFGVIFLGLAALVALPAAPLDVFFLRRVGFGWLLPLALILVGLALVVPALGRREAAWQGANEASGEPADGTFADTAVYDTPVYDAPVYDTPAFDTGLEDETVLPGEPAADEDLLAVDDGDDLVEPPVVDEDEPPAEERG